MNGLIRVFGITARANSIRVDLLLRLAVGVVFLIIGLVGFVFRKRTQERSPKKFFDPVFIFMTGWEGCGYRFMFPCGKPILQISITCFMSTRVEGSRSSKVSLMSLISNPLGGCAAGDRITIGDQVFEVNYYRTTPQNTSIPCPMVLRRAMAFSPDSVITRV